MCGFTVSVELMFTHIPYLQLTSIKTNNDIKQKQITLLIIITLYWLSMPVAIFKCRLMGVYSLCRTT